MEKSKLKKCRLTENKPNTHRNEVNCEFFLSSFISQIMTNTLGIRMNSFSENFSAETEQDATSILTELDKGN